MERNVLWLLITGGLISIAGGYLTWKYANFFLARRDYYINSKSSLFKKKLSMSIGVVLKIIFLTLMITGSITSKIKKQNGKQKVEIKNKYKKYSTRERESAK